MPKAGEWSKDYDSKLLRLWMRDRDMDAIEVAKELGLLWRTITCGIQFKSPKENAIFGYWGRKRGLQSNRRYYAYSTKRSLGECLRSVWGS
jgi:hypothetical protein